MKGYLLIIVFVGIFLSLNISVFATPASTLETLYVKEVLKTSPEFSIGFVLIYKNTTNTGFREINETNLQIYHPWFPWEGYFEFTGNCKNLRIVLNNTEILNLPCQDLQEKNDNRIYRFPATEFVDKIKKTYIGEEDEGKYVGWGHSAVGLDYDVYVYDKLKVLDNSTLQIYLDDNLVREYLLGHEAGIHYPTRSGPEDTFSLIFLITLPIAIILIIIYVIFLKREK